MAGSGSCKYPSPDLLAGNAIRRLAIECKVTKENKKYFTEDEITQLKTFSEKFGAESWIAVRFPNEPWYFLIPEDLQPSGNSRVISVDLARRRGLNNQEVIANCPESPPNRKI